MKTANKAFAVKGFVGSFNTLVVANIYVREYMLIKKIKNFAVLSLAAILVVLSTEPLYSISIFNISILSFWGPTKASDNTLQYINSHLNCIDGDGHSSNK